MPQYREETVETTVEPAPAPIHAVEERTVDAGGTVSRVVHSTAQAPSAFPAAADAVRRPRRTVTRSWFRSSRTPVDVASTEYTDAAGSAPGPDLAQFLRVTWFLLGLI